MTTGVVWERPPAADVAAQNWSSAVRTYRQAIDLYRHVLNLRTRRRPGRLQPAITLPPVESNTVALEFGMPMELTQRECEIARLLVLGYTNAQIAEALVITRGTSANHVAHILAKLGAANRAQAVARLLQPPAEDGKQPARSKASLPG